MAAYDPIRGDSRPMPLQFPVPVMDDPGERVRRMMREKFEFSTPELYVEPQKDPEAAAVEAAVDLAPPARMVPNVTRPMRAGTPATDAGMDYEAAAAHRSAQEEDFGSQVRPGGKDYEEPGLELPGAPPSPRRPMPSPEAAAAGRNAPAEMQAERQERQDAQAQARADRAAAPPRQAARDAGERAGKRRKDAREVGVNADPKKVEADRQAALDDIRKPKPQSAVKDMEERKDRAAVAADTRRYQQEVAAYDAKRRELETRRDTAIELGRVEEADAISAEIDQLPVPQPTGRMRGGQTAEEVMEPVAATIERLPAAERKALKAHMLARYGSDASAQRRADEDFINSYDGLPPDERYEAMMADAQRVMAAPTVPTVMAPVDTVPGGRGAGIGDNARNEDMDPADLHRAGRDVYSGFPMMNRPGQRGGTFVQNPNGAWSPRMPAPAQAQAGLLNDAEALPIRPTEEQMTPQWRERMKFAGLTLGLDPQGFDNENAFIAASQTLLERYRERAAKYDTVPVVTGGYRATPNAAHRQDMANQERYRSTRDFIRMYPRRPDGSTDLQEELLAASNAGDVQRVAEIKKQIRQEHEMSRAQAAKDYTKRQNETRLMQNPNVAPAMFRESLAQAGNDPVAIATVYRQFGMFREADQIMARENQRISVEGQAERRDAETNALNRKGDDDKVFAWDANAAGVKAAVDQAFDDELPPETAVNSYMIGHNQAAGDDQKSHIAQPEAAQQLARAMLASRGAAAWQRPVVQMAVRAIAEKYLKNWARAGAAGVGLATDNRTAFIRDVVSRLGPGLEDMAGQWWDTNAR